MINMSSSPIVYPTTSSPSMHTPRKKRKLAHQRGASSGQVIDERASLQKSTDRQVANEESSNGDSRAPLRQSTDHGNASKKTIAGFQVDDDSEDEGYASFRLLQPPSSPPHPSLTPDTHDGNRDGRPSLDGFRDIDLINGDTRAAQMDVQYEHVSRHSNTVATSNSLQRTLSIRTCSGQRVNVKQRNAQDRIHYSKIAAERSHTAKGKAERSYFGVDIHEILDAIKKESESDSKSAEAIDTPPVIMPSIERPIVDAQVNPKAKRVHMWTEKYRAKKFTDLIGDERTHRSVLKWLKSWDSIVFPHRAYETAKLKRKNAEDAGNTENHRKILVLTGPPGLGKTTLAHVCAKQAGYEVQEINASDERSRDVVRGRIRDMVGTENVRTVDVSRKKDVQKAARPVCVVVDEVDGVVSGSGGGGSGEGGFVKALMDLLAIDQKNSRFKNQSDGAVAERKSNKGDKFRMRRPIILICNDLYHPSLRLLRQGTTASITEIIHVRRPALTNCVGRLQTIFEREGTACDIDAVRALCESIWGVPSGRKDAGTTGSGNGEGDVRSLLVAGEWVAAKFRALDLVSKVPSTSRLTKKWLETHILSDLASSARSLGRGGSRDVVDRVFKINAGFSTSESNHNRPKLKVGETMHTSQLESDKFASTKSQSCARLASMIESCGDSDDRIVTDLFAQYLSIPFQDDTLFTKPNAVVDWLHFHSHFSDLIHHQQSFDLYPYLTYPVLAFHHLFATAKAPSIVNSNNTTANVQSSSTEAPAHPLTTPQAARIAHETSKANTSILQELRNTLSIPLQRSFRNSADLATDLVPYLLRILSPDIKPVIVGGASTSVASVRRDAEKRRVSGAVEAMLATGMKLERSKVDWGEDENSAPFGRSSGAGWVYRMEPAMDSIGEFELLDQGPGGAGKVRYAIRQVIEQEWRKESARREGETRQRRVGNVIDDGDIEMSGLKSKNDRGMDAKSSGTSASKGTQMKVKRDFFGRPVTEAVNERPMSSGDALEGPERPQSGNQGEGRVWVTYHEGFSNAVRKPITMRELLDGM